ncbi:MAG: HAD family hydrolase [Lachnospiraceae bacterium]|nr:HAD family hydrolase [Lachnospiraceae bacterium]
MREPMKRPQMILFDYGQTLIAQEKFNAKKGNAALMQYVAKNRYNKTVEEIQAAAAAVTADIGRASPSERHLAPVEITAEAFDAYLYESLGIELAISYDEAQRIFWDAAAPGKPTEGMEDFLRFLKEQGIRTGVVSNISFSREALTERLNRLLPDNKFEFIIASSYYVFRKPSRRIFDLALAKADLKPEEVWFVGDEYECDIVGAGTAGMFPVWYTGYLDFEQDMSREAFRISDWSELKEYILRLGG